jgi:hypothetical protein
MHIHHRLAGIYVDFALPIASWNSSKIKYNEEEIKYKSFTAWDTEQREIF